MGISSPHRGRIGHGLLRHDPRPFAQRRGGCVRGPARLRRRGPALRARGECQRRRSSLRFGLGRCGGHRRQDDVYPHRLEHGSLHIPRGVCRLLRAVCRNGAEVLGEHRRMETALYLLGQVRRQPHGGGGPLRDRRGSGGARSGRPVRRDPCPRLAHLFRRHRREARVGQAAGGAHARHGVRPQRRERQHAGLRHREGRHDGRGPRDRRLEPHAQYHHRAIRHPAREGRNGPTTPCGSREMRTRRPSGASTTRS